METSNEPDYVRLFMACELLRKRIGSKDSSRLCPDHDVIYLCFPDVELSEQDVKDLNYLGCHRSSEHEGWAMFVSC